MIKGAERLLESFGHNGWELNDRTGEIELFNHDGTRQLTYHVWEETGMGKFASLSLRFLNEHSGWNDVFSLKVVEGGSNQWVVISVTAQGKSDGNFAWISWDPTFDYSHTGRRRSMHGGFEGTDDVRVLEDRKELLPPVNELPGDIDLDLTASLFVDQFARGEMVRPVLVPAGLLTLAELTGSELDLINYGRNLDAVTKLLARARTDEEVRVARAVYKWVEGQRPVVERGI